MFLLRNCSSGFLELALAIPASVPLAVLEILPPHVLPQISPPEVVSAIRLKKRFLSGHTPKMAMAFSPVACLRIPPKAKAHEEHPCSWQRRGTIGTKAVAGIHTFPVRRDTLD